MSSNGRKNLWKDMLSDFQQRTSFWLKKIQKEMIESSGTGDSSTNENPFSSVSDDEFKKFFLNAVNNR